MQSGRSQMASSSAAGPPPWRLSSGRLGPHVAASLSVKRRLWTATTPTMPEAPLAAEMLVTPARRCMPTTRRPFRSLLGAAHAPDALLCPATGTSSAHGIRAQGASACLATRLSNWSYRHPRARPRAHLWESPLARVPQLPPLRVQCLPHQSIARASRTRPPPPGPMHRAHQHPSAALQQGLVADRCTRQNALARRSTLRDGSPGRASDAIVVKVSSRGITAQKARAAPRRGAGRRGPATPSCLG
mmetsp:Transcript_1569/g.3528  ORF Transcript_1569/g.3528 Transcript_1569/m.3528 type:complete len:245 (+) Transcript_1569:1032-1766(+)